MLCLTPRANRHKTKTVRSPIRTKKPLVDTPQHDSANASTIHTQPLKGSSVFGSVDPDAQTRISDRHDKGTRSTIVQDEQYTPVTKRSSTQELELAKLSPLPDYRYQSFIGRGGMGVVIRAEDKRLNREVAIKLPLPQFLDDDHFRERFLREARSVAALRHPNICPIYDFGQHGDQLYLVMPFIEGITLDDWIYDQEHDARQKAEMLASIADAVAAAHQADIIHRDLKPSNILVDTENQQPLLMDFGLAKQTADENASLLTQDGQIVGTPAYMSPEQARGSRDVDARADIYSLGAILYEMLCEQPPYTGGMRQILLELDDGPPPAPKKINTKVHIDLETICLKAMQRSPKDRYLHAADLAADLRRFAHGESIVARRLSRHKRVINFCRRHFIACGLAAALLLSSVIGIVWFANTTGKLQSIINVQELLSDSKVKTLIEENERTQIGEQIQALATYEPDAAQQAQEQYVALLQKCAKYYLSESKLNEKLNSQLTRLINDIAAANHHAGQELLQLLEERQQSWYETARLNEDSEGWQQEQGLWIPKDPQLANTHLTLQNDYKVHVAWEQWDHSAPLRVHIRNGQQSYYSVSLSQQSYSDDQDLKWELVIKRGNAVLMYWPIPDPNSKASLTIQCEQGQFHISYREKSFHYRDIFPISFQTATAYLSQPASTKVKLAQAFEKKLRGTPNALEQGDNHFAKGDWNAAAESYQEQAIKTDQAEIKLEAHYKRARSLLKLGETEKAHDILRQLLNTDSKQWGSLAGCQLWASLLKVGNTEEAEHIATLLDLQYDRVTITANLPFELQLSIRKHYLQSSTGAGILTPDPNRLPGLKNLVKASEMTSSNARLIGLHYYMYLRALHWEQQYDEAIKVGLKFLQSYSHLESRWTAHILSDIAWIQRLRGRQQEAIQLIDNYHKRIHIDLYNRHIYAPEYARCLHELGRSNEAKQLLAGIPSDELTQNGYHLYADVFTLLAMLQSDDNNKRQYFQLASPSQWETHNPNKRSMRSGFSSYYLLLCSQFENDSATANRLTSSFVNNNIGKPGDGNSFHSLFRNIQFDHKTLTKMWRSRRGKTVQNDFFFRRHDFRATTRQLLCLFVYSEVQKRITMKQMDALHDEMIWSICERSFEHYQTLRMDVKTIISVAFAYKGVTNALGWGYAKQKLPNDIKAEVAYLLYLHYTNKGKTADAADMLSFAKINLQAGSVLSKILNQD